MESHLQFLKFESDRLGFVYENIPFSASTCKLLNAAKHQISTITFDQYSGEVSQLLASYIEMDSTKLTDKQKLLKEFRDLLIFGEKLNFVKQLDVTRIAKEFSWNQSPVENTILLILALYEKPVEGDAVEQIKLNTFLSFSTPFNMVYIVEGLIHQEGKAVPHCFKNVIDRIIPLDVQLQFKYHYQLKEKDSALRLHNHFVDYAELIRIFVELYSELNYQMKYILLKKTRKALSIRDILNECFSDVLRVLIVEFVEFFTIRATQNDDDAKTTTEQFTRETALSLSFVNLLSEVKQTAALVSVLNVIKQIAVRHEKMKQFLSLASWFVNVKAKTNEGRLPERLNQLQGFFKSDGPINVLLQYIEASDGGWFFYHKELFFLRACRLFDDDKEASFAQIDETEVDRLFTALGERVDVDKFNTLVSKNSDIPQKIVTNFNYNSYGNQPFARIVFFFLQKPFDLKMKKKILMETVLSYAFIFSSACASRLYGKLSNYLRRHTIESDGKIRLKFECEEIEKFLLMNGIDTVSRDSFFNRFLHSYISATGEQQR